MMVMGRDGKFWAAAEPANANVANKAAKTILRICFLQRAISNLMVRSAATPRVSNHEATGLKYPLPPVTRTLDRHKPIDYAMF